MTTADSIQNWLVAQLARELHLDPATIDPRRPISVLGLDSLTAVTLVADLEDLVGRSLSESLFREELTIAELSHVVAGGATAVEPKKLHPSAAAATPPRLDYASLDYGDWSRTQSLLQRAARAVVRIISRQEISGLDRLPASGPVVLAINHLHILDALWVFAILPRRTIFLVAHEFRRRPLVGWLLGLGHAIFVARGAGDRQAIEQAVTALQSGAAVGIAPEGRLSRTGGLLRGQTGVARLASGASAPVVPIAMSGQEQLWRWWLRGRRVPVRIRIGKPIDPPPPGTTARALDVYTEHVMTALARELPPAYRGVYSQL